MTADLLTALVVFAFVTSITPGPNNMLLLASGVNYGFRRTIPQMLGVSLGFCLMILLVGLGIGQAFQRFPVLYAVLKITSVVYMLWLAWKIAMSSPISSRVHDATARPMTFLQACAFQWVNPKGWTMCLTAVSAFTVPAQYLVSLLAVVAAYFVVNLPSVSAWTVFGVSLRGLLADPKRVQIFNLAMAIALLASLWPVVAEHLR